MNFSDLGRCGFKLVFTNRLGGVRWISFLLLSIVPVHSIAGNTGYIGGNGGTATKTVNCPSGERITGLQVKKGSVIDSVRFKCRPMNGQGGWGSGSSYTSWSGGGGGSSTPVIECPTDYFVWNLRGATGKYVQIYTVVAGIQIGCAESDQEGKATGNTTNKYVGGGSWGSWKKCPGNNLGAGLASGADVRYGKVVDKLRLKCTDPVKRLIITPPLKMVLPKITLPTAKPWGWSNGFTQAELSKYNLNASMLGKTMKDVIQGNVSVRSDGKKCKECHMNGNYMGGVQWGNTTPATLSILCNQDSDDNDKVDFGVGFQHAWGKPANIKKLMWDWNQVNCRN